MKVSVRGSFLFLMFAVQLGHREKENKRSEFRKRKHSALDADLRSVLGDKTNAIHFNVRWLVVALTCYSQFVESWQHSSNLEGRDKWFSIAKQRHPTKSEVFLRQRCRNMCVRFSAQSLLISNHLQLQRATSQGKQNRR